MRYSLPAALVLTFVATLPSVAQTPYVVPAGRSPIPLEGERLAGLIPAKRLVPEEVPTAVAPADAIHWGQAGKYVNQKVTVKGTIVDTKDIGNLTFLNFAQTRGDDFYAVVFKAIYHRFPGGPEQYFKGKAVTITGTVTLHKGRPQIEIRDAAQITVVAPGAAETSGASAADAGAVIPWAQAAGKVGQTVTAQGRVHSTKDIGNLTFVNFSTDRSAFYFVVFKDAYSQFPQPPEQYLLGKTVRVTGQVTEHKGRAQIEVRSASQVEVVK